jgi:hypothetical protein
MEKFWQWMDKKEYGWASSHQVFCGDGDIQTPTDQQLIGYMLEYIREKANPENLARAKYAAISKDCFRKLEMTIAEITE